MPIKSWAEYFSSLHWLGAVYTYRPWKIGYRSVHRQSAAHYAPNWSLYLLALFPVLVSAVGAFVIVWYAVPIGWNCRHVWIVGLTVTWLLSNLFTIWLHNDKIPAKEIHKNDIEPLGDDSDAVAAATNASPQPTPNSSGTPVPNPSPNTDVRDRPDGFTTSCAQDASAEERPLMGNPAASARDDRQADESPPDHGGLVCRLWRFILGRGHWTERRRWYVLLLKDAIVGLGGLAVVFLSTSGVFNSCWCWSGYMWHRWLPGDWGRQAFVPLNTDEEYTLRASTVYEHVVWASLLAQIAFFFGIVFLWWDGITVVRWNESRKSREWRHELLGPSDTGPGGKIEYDQGSYLLFWFSKEEFAAETKNHRRRRSTFTNEQRGVRGERQEDEPGSQQSRPRSSSVFHRVVQRTPTSGLERGD
jgi:hypothetical protein